MGDPTAVERCRGGLLDGRWSGGGRPWVSRPSSSVFGKVMGPRALRARRRRWRGPKGRREGSQVWAPFSDGHLSERNSKKLTYHQW